MPIVPDVPVTLVPAPAPSTKLSAELHFRYGSQFIEIDVQTDNGQTRRYKVAISPAQETTLENVIAAVIKAQTGATTLTFQPDPTPGG